tara:strand:+ start:1539 stop:1793 length:255 start_codon:yes stop_codon:yes gene_type:complete
MPKTNNIELKTRRSKGKDKKKNTFKKYGKNTTRGLRIKQAELKKKSEKIKNKGNQIKCSINNPCKGMKGTKNKLKKNTKKNKYK